MAQWKAEQAARRPEVAKLADDDRLRQQVQDRLAGVIARPDGKAVPGPIAPWGGRRLSRRRELTACLATGRALRVPSARTRGRGKGFISPKVKIRQRPAEVEDRAVPGHW